MLRDALLSRFPSNAITSGKPLDQAPSGAPSNQALLAYEVIAHYFMCVYFFNLIFIYRSSPFFSRDFDILRFF